MEDGDRKEFNELDFRIELEEVLYGWIDLGFNK